MGYSKLRFFGKAYWGTLLLLLLANPIKLGAQSENKTNIVTGPAAQAYYWLEFSGGLGSISSGSVSLNGEVGPIRLGLEYRESSMGELEIFGEPNPRLRAFNLKAGKLFKAKLFLVDLHAGVGFGSYGVPVNVSSRFLGYDYDIAENPSFSWVVAAQASFNLKVFLLGLNVGATGARADAGFYAGLTLGFGKFF